MRIDCSSDSTGATFSVKSLDTKNDTGNDEIEENKTWNKVSPKLEENISWEAQDKTLPLRKRSRKGKAYKVAVVEDEGLHAALDMSAWDVDDGKRLRLEPQTKVNGDLEDGSPDFRHGSPDMANSKRHSSVEENILDNTEGASPESKSTKGFCGSEGRRFEGTAFNLEPSFTDSKSRSMYSKDLISEVRQWESKESFRSETNVFASSESRLGLHRDFLSSSEIRRREAKETFYSCQHCGITFEDCIMYTIHMGYHGFQNAFKCNMCGEETNNRVEFFIHIARKAHH